MTAVPTPIPTCALPTTTGVSPVQTGYVNSAPRRPYCLELVHVRMPPGFTPSNTIAPANVHKALYNCGKYMNEHYRHIGLISTYFQEL